MSKELKAILSTLAHQPAAPVALATLVTVEGSSYRRPGARLLLLADGTRVGSISGGCLEDDVIARARGVLESGQAETALYDTTTENDLVWGTGLGCHGVVRVFIEKLMSTPEWTTVLRENFAAGRETRLVVDTTNGTGATRLAPFDLPARTGVYVETIPPPTRLAIFGAGDDARPLVRFAKELGWNVTVADSRPAYLTAARFPEADNLVGLRIGEHGAAPALAPQTLAVVMTHRYRDDVPLLRDLLPQSLAYLGLLGPKKRADRILETLAAEGLVITTEIRARLYAPVGLDLGATTPETVALAILAGMQATLAGRTPIHLRNRTQPIHG